jgi:hypothetical protein
MSWCSNAPEDQSICLFEGFLANPDMPLSQYLMYTRTFSNKCMLLDLAGVQLGQGSLRSPIDLQGCHPSHSHLRHLRSG